jgi:hypothetical protein
MGQNNSLRILERILTIATSDPNSKPQEKFGLILLKSMNLDIQPENMVDFYGILSRARDEAASIQKDNIEERYIKPLDDFYGFFVENDLWNGPYAPFESHIKQKNILTILDSLADFFGDQNPRIMLSDDCLPLLRKEFELVLENVIKSDLSQDIKKFLTKGITQILKGFAKYEIDGGETLEQSIKKLISNLVLSDHNIKSEDRQKPGYTKSVSLILVILIHCIPTPWDIIGAVPDIHDFWIPQYSKILEKQKEVESIVKNCSSMKESIEKASCHLVNQQKLIPGKEQKSLPPGK